MTTVPTSETDILLMAIQREKASFAHLAAVARACTSPQAKRLYNQLALDELKHLLTLVNLLEGLADDWLSRLDLTFPVPTLTESLPKTEEEILRSTLAEEEQSENFFRHMARAVEQEELSILLENLRAEEEGHRARLRSMLYGLEADRPVVSKWLRSIRRLIPAATLY
jgi:rubrerythrin